MRPQEMTQTYSEPLCFLSDNWALSFSFSLFVSLSIHSMWSIFHDYYFNGRRTALQERIGWVNSWIAQDMEKEIVQIVKANQSSFVSIWFFIKSQKYKYFSYYETMGPWAQTCARSTTSPTWEQDVKLKESVCVSFNDLLQVKQSSQVLLLVKKQQLTLSIYLALEIKRVQSFLPQLIHTYNPLHRYYTKYYSILYNIGSHQRKPEMQVLATLLIWFRLLC